MLKKGGAMNDATESPDVLIDFITGESVPDVGAEANRQAVERFLVDDRGYPKDAIEVGPAIELTVNNEPYASRVDLVVRAAGTRFMAIKCAAGSLGSREREILAAARLLDRHQIPVSAVSDGKTAIVLDTLTGKTIGEGLAAIPDRQTAETQLKEMTPAPLPEDRRDREKLIFRSYDSMTVNR
jgi:hypothetical protein